MALKPPSLDKSFTQPTPQCYWHHLMKTKFSDKTYASSKIDTQIKHIKEKCGINSFVSKADHGLTPAHVAALSGNASGLKFLRQKEALTDQTDDNGFTARNYAEQYHPELLEYFDPREGKKNLSRSLQPAISLPAALQGLFAHITPPKGKFHYSLSQDFGAQTTTFLVPKCDKEGRRTIHFIDNMKKISAELGIGLQISPHTYVPRDTWMRLPNGTLVLPGQSDHVLQAIERVESLALFFRKKGCYLTDHFSLHPTLGSAIKKHKFAADDYADFVSKKRQTIRFYAEGGNFFCLTNSKGQTKLLVGEDSFLIACQQMRLDGIFKTPNFSVDGLKNSLQERLTDRQLLQATLQEMYSQGLLKSAAGMTKGLILEKERNIIKQTVRVEEHKSSSNPFIARAIQLQAYSPLQLNENDLLKGKEMAINYLIQKELTKAIMAKTFNIADDDVIVLPQADLHLDFFIKAGPHGSVLVQDYAMTEELLKVVEKQGELSVSDQTQLNYYLKNTQTLKQQLTPLLKQTVALLNEAGFTTISVPGAFFDQSPTLRQMALPVSTFHNLNFLNANSGWSEKLNAYYYIVAGAKVGDKLGQHLMLAFSTLLERIQPGIKTYFVGHDPKDPTDFTEAMQLLNGALAGYHCMSFELGSNPHIES